MTPDDAPEISSASQHRALAHPLRHRVLFALGHEATVGQLAAALGSHKGTVAHHLKVLEEAGLVELAGTRQVRGGTERYYRRTAPRLTISDSSSRAVALRAVADEIASAAPDPFLVLRTLRLTPAQVEQITATLAELAHGTEDAGDGAPRYGLLLGLYRPKSSPP
jgi:DNA-binding transcriptional ArsR family regulator